LNAATYTITVTDSHGCLKELTITVDDSVCSPVTIHDGISPNGDGVNDTWIIDAIQEHPRNVVQIYDKFGDLVFEQSDYQNDWSGRGKDGKALPDGTYYYLVKLNDDNGGGKSVLKGALMVKR
jgi:gliding motility-associated-like protein